MTTDAGRLIVDGLVARVLSLSVGELARRSSLRVAYDFHCHEGWTVPGIVWEGVPIASLLEEARPRPSAKFLNVHAAGYTIVLPLEQVAAPGVLLALRRNGAPLPSEQGIPLRLVGPSEWDCYSSVKHVERLEVTSEPAEATGPGIALARIGR